VNTLPRFRDRRDAGRQLGRRMVGLRAQHPVVLGLARGGVPVAFEVAAALRSPFDVLVVRKLGVPLHTELAFGAIGEEDAQVLNSQLIRRLGLTRRRIAKTIAHERAELRRRATLYRGDRAPLALRGRSVVIVDDGLATGSTAHVAYDVAIGRGAAAVVVAVPVSPPETIEELEGCGIKVIALEVPDRFRAVGEWYDDFEQTTDDEVISLLLHPPPIDEH